MTDRHRSHVRDFLATRRARISPQQAGLTSFGHRRVPGLRREEVATIAGVSAELFAPMFDGPVKGSGALFMDPASADFYPAWDRSAREMVAGLRGEAGRNPHDRALQDLVGELSTRSHEFRTMWAAHDVRVHRTGSKTVHHPLVGPMELSCEAMSLSADADMTLDVFVAARDSPSAEAPRPARQLDGHVRPAPRSHPGARWRRRRVSSSAAPRC